MEIICKKCGVIFTLDGELPSEFECFCNSQEFKLIKQ